MSDAEKVGDGARTEGVEVNFEILKANIDFPTQFAAVLARYGILLVYR